MDHCLGNRIRSLRKQKGLTLEKLGEKADICCKYIGEIERGVKTPTVTVLQKIASALEVHAGLLLSQASSDEKHFDSLASINIVLHGRDIETLNRINRILKIVFEEKGF